jgi:hypothetical protein
MRSCRLRASAAILGVCGLALVSSDEGLARTRTAQRVPGATPGSTAGGSVLAAVVVDAQGRPVRQLGPADFEVTVDGATRRVVDVVFVFRGPGAETSAGRLATATGGRAFAERQRSVVVAADEDGIQRGDERSARRLAGVLLDRLGMSDRAAVVRLPGLKDEVQLTTDRRAAQSTVGKISGRATPPGAIQAEQPPALNDGDRPLAPQHTVPPVEVAADAQADPLAPLTRLLTMLRETPGWKTVLVVSAGLGPVTSGRTPGSATASSLRCLDAAARAQAAVHLVLLPGSDRAAGSQSFERVAVASGGAVWRLGRDTTRDLDRLSAGLTGLYELVLAPAPEDRDRALHDVRVVARRAAVQVRAATRWASDVPVPGVIAVDPAPAAAPTRAAPPDASAAAAASSDGEAVRPVKADPELDLVVGRAADYLQAYARDYTNIVAEERYEQRLELPASSERTEQLRGRTETNMTTRVLRSDLLMVSTPDLGRWLPFRDVFDVDGTPIRDREDRLKKLFVEVPKNALGNARRITEESARYNLGSFDRTTNVPTLALELLSPANLPRLRMARRGEDQVEGTRAVRIDFEEPPTGTLIRTGGGGDVPARGSYWVDPSTGRILRTVLRTEVAGVKSEVTVTYRRFDSVGLWLPAEMHERYTHSRQVFDGVARYSNVRRFQVTTDQSIK